ncbi:MAG: polyisoprenoid-binding protein [Rhodobacterales bacterium CG15_BIG_FIL_POST_REV_8_21_14_020_59_13]|nr:MAG: polyisoprenoid-binding protein [Rhodobacterales bacterium CG15_BIG_FIL_POST_REV_8_21_14_020_59_13]
MRIILPVLMLAVLAILGGCVSAPTQDPADLPSGNWQLDTEHASAHWRSRHFGLAWFTARFDSIDASLDFDPSEPEGAQLTAIIDAGSVSTGNAAFDETLRGPNWFSAERHPQIIFRSSSIAVTGEDTGVAEGELTIRGIAHPARMDIVFYGGNFNFLENRDVIGFGADMVVSRSDYGIGPLIPATIAGDEVRIRIEAEFLRDE